MITEELEFKLADYIDTLQIIKKEGIVGVVLIPSEQKAAITEWLVQRDFAPSKTLRDDSSTVLDGAVTITQPLPPAFEHIHVFLLNEEEYATFSLMPRLGPVCDLTTV